MFGQKRWLLFGGLLCFCWGGGWLFGLPQVVFCAFPVQYPQRVGLSFVVGI